MGEIEDKVKGKFHEVKGKATGDRSEQLKGKAEQTRGAVKGKLNDVKDTLSSDEGERQADTYSTTGSTGETV